MIIAFGLGLMIQIGFLTHHVALVAPSLGTAGASATVLLLAAGVLSAPFGAGYGAAATGIQLVSALGPTFFGVLRDLFGGYGPPLLIAAALDVVAGGRPLTTPAEAGQLAR